MYLYIDSGTHSFTDTEERIEGIEENLCSPDVVFTEDPTADYSLTDVLRVWPLAPLLVTAMVFYVGGLRVAQRRMGDDREIKDHLIEEHGAEEIPTDKSKIDLVLEIPRVHLTANWMIILIAFGTWHEIGHPVLTLGYPLIVASFALLLTFLAGAHPARNEHIASKISDSAEKYHEACLITGSDHHEQVGTLLENYEGVEVLNPVPA